MAGKCKLELALQKNTNNPSLAWHLYKRFLLFCSDQCPPCIPTISRILIRSKMLKELHYLHQHLIRQQWNSPSSLLSFVRILGRSGLLQMAISQLQSFRSRYPSESPPNFIYNVLIESSIQQNRVDLISFLYKDMIDAGTSPNTYTFNMLIHEFVDCGQLVQARELFYKMRQKGCIPNIYSFGILARGYCKYGHLEEAVELLNEMSGHGITPNNVIYTTLISSLCREGRDEEADRILEEMMSVGVFPDIVTFNSRISALCCRGEILEAWKIFRDMKSDEGIEIPRPNSVTFKVMLEGVCREGTEQQVDSMVEMMKMNGEFTGLECYNMWLLSVMRSGNLLKCKYILREMVDKGVKFNTCTYNILVHGLCKGGMIVDASVLISSMESNNIYTDVVTYTTLLNVYCRKGKVSEANLLLRKMMDRNCSPNSYTCNMLIHSLCRKGRMTEAKQLLHRMNDRGYDWDIVTCNILLGCLCKDGKMDEAIEIVDDMWCDDTSLTRNAEKKSFFGLKDNHTSVKKCVPNVITYTIIIDGLCKAGRFHDAKRMFVDMIRRNIQPDSTIFNTFIHSFCKNMKLSSAFRVLKDMEKYGCSKNVHTYNSLVLGLSLKNEIFEIHGVMDEMEELKLHPDVCTYNNLMYCLCEGGNTKDAISVLDRMMENSIKPNISTFKVLIKSLIRASEFKLAQEVFEFFVREFGNGEVLHGLMFNELVLGGEVFQATNVLKIALDNHFCLKNFQYKDLIDKLCKVSKLGEAMDILFSMIVKGYRIDPTSFVPVIDGLRTSGNIDKANFLTNKMMEMALEQNGISKKSLKPVKRGTCFRGGQQNLKQRCDDSAIALKVLKSVQKGWGQTTITKLLHSNKVHRDSNG